MNLATLRIEGEEPALEALAKALPLVHDSRWKKGDSRRNGTVHSCSGFVATVADAENPGQLVILVRAFLEECKKRGVVFSRFALSAELSLGFTVGDSVQFVAGVEFSPSDLQALSECDITLSITAYPTSDEANAEENAP